MPRIRRIVLPGEPHHIIQRGNRRLPVFFCEEDYQYYIEVMREWCDKRSVSIWAYCLMSNHIHLIAVPETEDGLRLAIGEAHRRYTLRVNRRKGWTGHLWQGRFSSFVMDEPYLIAAARYVELNPVEAGMVKTPADYRWSSARAHLAAKDDQFVKAAPLLGLVPDWGSFLKHPVDEDVYGLMSQHESTGRPLGSESFFDRIQSLFGVDLRPKKPGRKIIK
ncbi:transposase [Desulfovibrio ferrophilus]|uniref:Transposase IS200-like domain-containing protein n=1 Tax=Desulfovibrio ferrophilus TaxID=241368 RepID=A0A2Z6AZ89_9BACT|nr:transposase [Desulfovibrio ferrophilus]BBD08495.1 uncharacterized protein DFE_1769 [Desulfovibrio ferrophilus]